MSLPGGFRIGPYEISGAVGAGGMGEVYRARDTKLGREVAVKVLPDLFASDPDRLARFAREAQVLASLNHPHIAHVYGVEDVVSPDAGRSSALVMEFVDGEDLAQRIARGPIPVPEALRIAREIADAIEAAHERGIIHRDLKPANVKVTEDGVVKVLDFGLAKALDVGSTSGHQLMNSPTITSPLAMTQMGVILGTAAYMAPEQAKGKAVDRSVDVWAFGAVLFEMLTGKPAFGGETVTDVLAAIVMRDPDWTLLPKDTPPSIARLLRRCLDRERRRRLADAGEVRYQIEEALTAPVAPAVAPTIAPAARRPMLAWLPWGVAALLAVVAGALIVREQGRTPEVSRYSIELPPKTSLSISSRPAVSIAPDGSSFVFVASVGGTDRLYRRRVNAFESTEIAGTDGASQPAISPDGRWVAFMTTSKLCKVPLDGGPVVTLADVSDPRGLSWDVPDTIVFTPQATGAVFTIPAGGGTPTAITKPEATTERTHRWPQMIGGGKAVLYTVGTFDSPDNYDNAKIEAVDLAGGTKKTILPGAAMAHYVDGGYLLFTRGTSLFAVRFDAASLEVKGTPVAILEGVGGDTTTGAAHFAVSPSGAIVYFSGAGKAGDLRPMWIDRTGRVTALDLSLGIYSDPRLSPDGENLAVSVVAGGGRDIWIHNFQRKTFTRLTFGGQNMTPAWSRDGSLIYYGALASDGKGTSIYRRASDGSRDPELLVTLPARLYMQEISADGHTALGDMISVQSAQGDVVRVPLQKDGKPQPVVATSADEFGGRLSPDGRWLAYCSVESGRPEVYVRPANGSGGRWQVSTGGGEEPKWSGDSRTLFYRYGSVMSAATTTSDAVFTSPTPQVVFSNAYNLRVDSSITYDVHPKDGRLIMIRPTEELSQATALRVIVNWTTELRAAFAR